MTAAVSPDMKVLPVTFVAGMSFFHDEVNELIATHFVSQFPRLRLCSVHQWRYNFDGPIHSQRESFLHGIHCVAAAIRIALKISLAHTCDNGVDISQVGSGANVGHEH